MKDSTWVKFLKRTNCLFWVVTFSCKTTFFPPDSNYLEPAAVYCLTKHN